QGPKVLRSRCGDGSPGIAIAPARRPRAKSMISVMMDQNRARAFRQFALRTTSFTAQGFIRPVPRLSGLKGLDARFLASAKRYSGTVPCRAREEAFSWERLSLTSAI